MLSDIRCGDQNLYLSNLSVLRKNWATVLLQATYFKFCFY
ncbi:hypothetical protein DLH77_15550 [Vibrio parahaemolyticus]|nr:hypothetical protein [Vibrio parahaemolyticus]EGR3134743.1 hypothetical protein [Vibrio parahaemolyticus]EGR3158143.1 hypothetical protein [Vibrio parahaemolyticus]